MSLKKRIKLFKNVEERAIIEKRKLLLKVGEEEKEIDVIVFPFSWFKELKLECTK